MPASVRVIPRLFLVFLLLAIARLSVAADREWSAYLGDKSASHYSTLAQITPANVAQLAVAWTWQAGDARPGSSQIQCNPLMVDGVLYATTAQLKLAALDAATGRELWRFEPFEPNGVNLGWPTGPRVTIGAFYLDQGVGCRRSMPAPAG